MRIVLLGVFWGQGTGIKTKGITSRDAACRIHIEIDKKR